MPEGKHPGDVLRRGHVDQIVLAYGALGDNITALRAHQDPEDIGSERPCVGRFNQDSAQLIPANGFDGILGMGAGDSLIRKVYQDVCLRLHGLVHVPGVAG